MKFTLLLTLLGILLGISLAGLPVITCSREEILNCFYNHVDLNGDHLINSTEVDTFMLYDPCTIFPPLVTGNTMIIKCDKNNDGYLSDVDYDHAQSCMNVIGYSRIVCNLCKQCDV